MDEFDADDWNQELELEVTSGAKPLVVFSRDWTVETIVAQVKRGNIDLNPKFQRRNAWNDIKRSKLIESLLLGVPVPEIVLAEDTNKRNSYIVIDGKQRLLAITGFFEKDREYWDTPSLKSLQSRPDLNGSTYADLCPGGVESQSARDLLNADIRCTVISNYTDNSVLYDIFYRLNTGSVPLSSQELRQVLNAGDFATYLIDSTNELIPLHAVLRLDGPDRRLRDAELLLRHISFSLFGTKYDGNLTPFLDKTMGLINSQWDKYEQRVADIVEGFHRATKFILETFPENRAGRKYTNNKWEIRFNRALFEVQVYYFCKLSEQELSGLISKKETIVQAFCDLSNNDKDFQDSIEVSTKNIDRYRTRFERFQDVMNDTLGLKVHGNPLN